MLKKLISLLVFLTDYSITNVNFTLIWPAKVISMYPSLGCSVRPKYTMTGVLGLAEPAQTKKAWLCQAGFVADPQDCYYHLEALSHIF